MNGAKYFLAGFISAVALFIIMKIAYNIYDGSKVYETKSEIKFGDNIIGNFTIPKGTKIIRKSSMPEGYDNLYINIRMFRGDMEEYLIESDEWDAYYYFQK